MELGLLKTASPVDLSAEEFVAMGRNYLDEMFEVVCLWMGVKFARPRRAGIKQVTNDVLKSPGITSMGEIAPNSRKVEGGLHGSIKSAAFGVEKT